jgi:ubiquinone/menaquinone biosynthesis C-methylase UbiE
MAQHELSDERFFIAKNKNWSLYYQHIARYLFATKFVEEKLVLDVACGTGYGTALLAEKAYRAVGIDISKEAIIHCKKVYKEDSVCFLNMDCTSLAFPNEIFDSIVSFETIEHIYDPEKFVKELYRVLKPGGQVLISTPNRDLYKVYNKNKVNRHHIHEFDASEFQKLMGSYFEIEKISGQLYFSKKDVSLLAPYTTKPLPFGPDRLVRKLIRVCIRNLLPDGPLRIRLLPLEIWANKCGVENIEPSNCVYIIGTMRKGQK